MITSSIVLFKTKLTDLKTVLRCAIESCIDLVYVIDNSPTDALKNEVLAFDSQKIVYTFGQGNIGYGAGNNIGIEKAIAAGSKYHIVLNADIIFEPGVIRALADYMDKHSDIGQLLPKVTYPDGSLQMLCKLLPTPLDIFGRRLLPAKMVEKRNAEYEMRFTDYEHARNCPLLSGCFMFLRTDLLREVGMFDDRFFMYFEDFDLMRRIHAVAKTVYYPEVTIVHNHAAEHRTNKTLLKISIQSAMKYFNKWGWLFDSERRRVNKAAHGEENVIKG